MLGKTGRLSEACGMASPSARIAAATRFGLVLTLSSLVAALLLQFGAALGVTTPVWPFNPLAHLPRALAVAVAVFGSLVGLAVGARTGSSARKLASRRGRALIPTLAYCALLVLLCLLLPDRSGFVGDFQLRQGAMASNGYGHMFPQSLPVDVLVFGGLLPGLAAATGAPLSIVSRHIGALAYAGFLAIALRASRSMSAPWPRWVTVTMLATGGLTSLYCGFARDTVLFVPLSLFLVSTLADRVSRRERLSALPEVLLILLLALHRSAVVLVAPCAFATAHAVRANGGLASQSLRWRFAAVGLLVVAASFAPTYTRIFFQFDAIRHLQWLAPAGSGTLPLLHPPLLLDAAGAILLLAPATLLTPIGLISDAPPATRVFSLLLVIAWLPLVVLIRPQQGAFRDYDVYAALAVTWTFVGLQGLCATVDRAPRLGRWIPTLAATVSLIAMASSLLVATMPAATESRILWALREPATRDGTIRASWLDYLAVMAKARGDLGGSARFTTEAADVAPTPVRLTRAGLALYEQGDFGRSREMFASLVPIDSSTAIGWSGYTAASLALGDSAALGSGLAHLRALMEHPGKRDVLLRFLDHSPSLDPQGELRARLQLARAEP